MKELSIEEKARAYDEALERAKNYWKTDNDNTLDIKARGTMEYLFPELADSNDERIRKELITFIKKRDRSGCDYDYDKWLVWLEKQGHTDNIIEKAKTEKQRVIITETDGNANIDWNTRSLEDARKLLECGLRYINAELEKQGKKPADKVEPIFRVGDHIRNKKTGDKVIIEQLDVATKAYCYVSYDGAAVNHSDFPFAKQNEWELLGHKVAEQKLAENSAKVSESSIEEKDMTEYKKGFECGKQRVLKYPEDFGLCKKPADTAKRIVNVSPIWSKVDEKIVTGIINDIQERLEDYPTEQLAERYFKEIKWLKSLKERYGWKPSDGQLHDLKRAIDSFTFEPDYLEELYEDLKKLKGG